MTKVEILSIIEKSKEINLESSSNLNIIFEFLQNFENNFSDILSQYDSSNVRFCDYYEESFRSNELTNYFIQNYPRKDKNEQCNYFILYSIFRKCRSLLEGLVLFEHQEFLEIFVDDIMDICSLIKKFHMMNQISENQGLGFDNHKYKLMFSGFSLDDVKFLDKRTTKSLVNKINNFLLEFDIVPGAEGVDHVRDKYNIPLLRIQLADDFRITFIRRKNVTIIVGIELKSGKDINYTKYDYIAKKINDIYLQADLLNKGQLDSEDIHYKVIQEIERKLGIKSKLK